MSYTPRRIIAWHEVHERLRGAVMADDIEVVAAGSHAGKKLPSIVKKLRESL